MMRCGAEKKANYCHLLIYHRFTFEDFKERQTAAGPGSA